MSGFQPFFSRDPREKVAGGQAEAVEGLILGGRMCNRKCSFNKENDKACYQHEVSSKTGGEEMGDPGLKCYLTDCSEDEGS